MDAKNIKLFDIKELIGACEEAYDLGYLDCANRRGHNYQGPFANAGRIPTAGGRMEKGPRGANAASAFNEGGWAEANAQVEALVRSCKALNSMICGMMDGSRAVGNKLNTGGQKWRW